MGLKNKISEGYEYFITLTVVDWVDVFTRPVYKQIVIDSLKFCQKEKGLVIYAWCLMSNHIHMIVAAKEGFNLSDIIRDFKKYTNKKIIEAIKENPESRREWMLNRFEYNAKIDDKVKNYKFWQDGSEAKEIHTVEFLREKLNYIHNNPVKAEIVEYPEEYLYSSAKDYSEQKGLLEIEKI